MADFGNAVTDPVLLAELNGNNSAVNSVQSNMNQPVTDKNLINELEGQQQVPSDILHNAQTSVQSQISGMLPGGKSQMSPGAQNVLLGIMSGGTSLIPGSLASGAFGAIQAPEGEKLKSFGENALLNLGLGKTFETIGNLIRPFNANAISKDIQNFHDSLDDAASKGFQEVSKGVNDRGISNVPIDNSIFDQIRDNKYFPKTPKFNNLIDDAQSGNYNALRDMQSELWTKGTKGVRSQSIADQNQGEEMLDVRDKINEAISNHLVNTGNSDLNDTLNQSRFGYQKLREMFYNKNLNRTIGDLVDPEMRLVPDKNTLVNALKENSLPMNQLKQFVSTPYVGTNYIIPVDLQSKINAINTREALSKLAKGAAIGGTAYHFLMPEKYKVQNVFEQNQ